MKKEMHHQKDTYLFFCSVCDLFFYFFEHLTKKHYLVNINVDSSVV